MSQPVVIHVEQVGRLGNVMIQYMAALFLMSRVRNPILSGVDIPDWKLYQPDRRPKEARAFVVHRDTPMRMPLKEIFDRVATHEIDCIEIRNYVQHVDNFLTPGFYRKVFQEQVAPPVVLGPRDLLINVRGEEVLSGGAPDYVLPPVDYLGAIVDETGLDPLFMGQLTPGPYLDALVARFPHARRIPSHGALADFALIRSARNIVLSISTFTWVAAWLSEAERIFFPVAGVFNPFQRPDIGMVPFEDPRFRFDLFPLYFALPGEQALEHHRKLGGTWRRMPGLTLRAMFESRPRFAVDLDVAAEVFDEEYYLQHNHDIRGAKQMGHLANGFEHYVRAGRFEGRRPFELDERRYCHAYPLAAFEIANGEYLDAWHHYAAIGRARGYERRP